MSIFGTPSPAGAQSSGGSAFGATAGGLFSTPSSSAAQMSTGSGFGGGGGLFGSAPAFDASTGGGHFAITTPSTQTFGASDQQQVTSLFGQTPSPFGHFQHTLAFGQPKASFGQIPQTSAHGQASPSPLFGGQLQQAPTCNQALGGLFGQVQSNPFQGKPSSPMNTFSGSLTTQMAPVAPVVVPLPDLEIQAIVDAYREDVRHPQDCFKYLLLSVTDPAARLKSAGVPDILWAEAIIKLEGMDSVDRERLWPELVHGFKDLSRRMKLQDEAIAADVQRLQATESNVKLVLVYVRTECAMDTKHRSEDSRLRRHFETDTLPWIQRLRQKEQELQRRSVKMMKMVNALEGKGMHMALNRGEANLGDYLRSLTRQLLGASAELPRRVETLLSASRMQIGLGGGLQSALLGPGQIDNQSLIEMHEVLRQQTEAISRLARVLKRDLTDIDIILTEDTEMVDGHADNDNGKSRGNQARIGLNKNIHLGF